MATIRPAGLKIAAGKTTPTATKFHGVPVLLKDITGITIDALLPTQGVFSFT